MRRIAQTTGSVSESPMTASVKVSRTRCLSPLLTLPLLSASDKLQGRKSRGRAAMSLAAAYGDLMLSVLSSAAACRGFDA